MRKSIKKIAATMLAATMVFGTFTSAFAFTTEDVAQDDGTTKKQITDLEDGEYIYLLAGNATGWDTKNPDAVLASTDKEGVLSFKFTIPATENEWEKRFSIVGNYSDGDDYVQGGWSRMLLGEPNYKANDSFTCLTTLAVDNLEADTEVTLYYDTRTATVYIEDAEGNAVDYTIGWLTNDRDEKYFTVDEFAGMTVDEFAAQLSKDRLADLEALMTNEDLKLTYSLFDGTYKANLEGLANYIKTGTDYVKADEEPTTEAPTTEAPTTEAPTTAAATTAAATTAANQATKTGDVAPVALMVVLFAAVATVAVVAKKKEA